VGGGLLRSACFRLFVRLGWLAAKGVVIFVTDCSAVDEDRIVDERRLQ
jgi:hypothetical protein